MFKRSLLLILLFTALTFTFASAFAQERTPEAPEPVTRALEYLAKARNVKQLTLRDIESYEFKEEFGNINDDCIDTASPGQRYYIVIIVIKNRDGSAGRYNIRVPTANDDTFTCSYMIFTATPTPTVDLTKTTATPTFTPSNTYTPSNTPTNTLTPTPSSTFTPTFTPTPTLTFTPSVTPRPSSVTCEGFLTSRLKVGEQGRVLDEPLRLRSRASASGSQVALMDAGATFGVLEGPECDPAGRAWWKVHYGELEGWTVEGQGEEYFTEPVAP
jgi:hypothetical protein